VMNRLGVVIACCLLGVYLYGMTLTEENTGNTTPNTIPAEVVRVPTTQDKIITTTTVPVRIILPRKPKTSNDELQLECQLELGESYCDEHDLDYFQHGEDW